MPKIKRKIIAIVGPTASGKTGIGVQLAKEFDGEIVSADSRQVYRGLDIGTGKDLKEYDGVKYHMIDIVEPEEKMTLFDYLPLARRAIEDIFSRGKLPIIVGGTGLYVQGLTEGFILEPISNSKFLISNQIPNPKPQNKQKLYSRPKLDKLTVKQLNDILEEIDPDKYAKIDHKNRRRLIRAIELEQEGLRPTKIEPDFKVLQIGVDVPRQELHERIDKRVDERFKAGMMKETEGLLKQGIDPEWLTGLGLEYKVMTDYLVYQSYPSFDQMSQDLKWKIHQFARRQMTWFRRFPEINWLSDYKEIKRFVKIFLEH